MQGSTVFARVSLQQQVLNFEALTVSNSKRELAAEDAERIYSIMVECVGRFVDAWETRPVPPRLAEFLPEDGEVRRLCLIELVKVDLEYGWRQRRRPLCLTDYLRDYPDLAQGGLPVDLIYEEFHIRKQAGVALDPTEYVARYPQQARQLRRLLGIGETFSTTALLAGRTNDALDSLAAGQQLDDFELLAELGRGAFARVFLARQQSMHRLVALKVSPDTGQEPQTLAQLDHEYIVRVYDSRPLRDKGLRLLYMQYLAGGTLHALLRSLHDANREAPTGRDYVEALKCALQQRGESLPTESPVIGMLEGMSWPQLVCWIGARLASGLHHAHRRGVLHRDVKPANVLLSPEGVPKLADFNVSFCSKIVGATPASYFGGSLAYMSPEQLDSCNPAHARAPESLDGRSDLYSLGVVLWELAVGNRPFPDCGVGNGWPAALQALSEDRSRGVDPRASSALPPDSAPGLFGVLQACLAPKPEDRWESGAALSKQLELCQRPRLQQLLYPTQGPGRFLAARLVMLMILGAAILPNVLAGVFNFVYNKHEIIDRLRGTEHAFLTVQAVINAIAYPLGLGIAAQLALPVARSYRDARQRAFPAPLPLKRVRRRCLYLGHYLALISVGEWLAGGFVYPVAMYLTAEPMPPEAYAHFFGSLLLCGLIAAAYPFFLVTYYCLSVIYPAFFCSDPSLRDDLAPLAYLNRMSWIYAASAALVPPLGILALVAMNSRARFALAILSGIGVLGFGFVVPLFRRIQGDSETFAEALRS